MSATARKIQETVEEYVQENEKFEAGNKSAGTRARKALMELKKLAGEARNEIQAKKNEE